MRIPSKKVMFWVLMALSALSAFIIPRSASPLRSAFQFLALLQWPTTAGARGTAEAIESAELEPISRERSRQLVEENERLSRQVINQRLGLQQARQRVEELTGLTGQMPGSYAGVIIAPVVGFDANPRGETLLIMKGRQSRWVREGQWVVAVGGASPAWDEDATVRDLLNRGWIIGRIIEARNMLARVQLVTDPRFRARVQVGRVLSDGQIQVADDSCLLLGAGAGRMTISQAVHDYFRSGETLVILPASIDLPVPMSLGWIEDSRPNEKSPRHFELGARPWAPAERLTHVYVIAVDS